MGDAMRKRRSIIGFTMVIVLTVIIILVIGGINVVNANKINDSIELGIKYLTEEEYNKAKSEFSKALAIDDEHEEAENLLELTEEYMELEDLYKNKDYSAAAELIYELKENKYSSYIEGKLSEILSEVEQKIALMNEVNNIEDKINQLINENKYQEGIDLINKYLNEDLDAEDLDKLNELMNNINECKFAYEEEQKRIEEERLLAEEKKAEEKKAEEERKKQEQANKQESSNKNESTSTSISGEEVNKQIWQMDALQMALEVVKREHPGYGPHYWERGIVSEGEPRWAFIFLKLKDPNVQDIGDTEIIGQVGYTVNERTGEVKQEDWLVQ